VEGERRKLDELGENLKEKQLNVEEEKEKQIRNGNFDKWL